MLETATTSEPIARQSSRTRETARLFRPVDIASAACFRIGYGLVMMWWSFDFIRLGLVNEYFVRPSYFFSYSHLAWIRPLPWGGMPILFGLLTILALMITVGLAYRLATVAHWCGFVYVFLIDQTNYQNHYYLLILIGALLPFMPLNRCWSFDAYLRPELRADDMPAWCLYALRFHIALPYFFGGIAKINMDWLTGVTLTQRLNLLLGGDSPSGFLTTTNLGTAMAWGGLLFDLGIVPLLLWQRTRLIGFGVAVLFHITNHFLFQIHIFPWFMIAATTLFLSPDWPRRFLSSRSPKQNSGITETSFSSLSWSKRIGLACLAVEMCLQIVLPLRCHFYAGDASWTERGHRFAWRMMLRSKIGMLQYLVTDPLTNETYPLDHTELLNAQQAGRFPRDPYLIYDFAQYVAQQYEQLTGRRPIVQAVALMSLNGRKPQLMINPQCDLAQPPETLATADWLLPLTEPRRLEAWNVPKEQWLQHVEVPLLRQYETSLHNKKNPQAT